MPLKPQTVADFYAAVMAALADLGIEVRIDVMPNEIVDAIRFTDDRQHAYVRDGWNLTGDSFRQDEDGRFHFAARSDDMIVSAGYNIAGPEVEAALLTHPDVAECAVIGVPHEARGRIVEAYVVLAAGCEGDALMAKRLQDHVKATIAPYKYPRSIRFVAALPKTATGKIQRFRLREGR